MRGKLAPLTRPLLPLAFWLGVWQGCALLVEGWVEGRGNELLLPYPATVARALAELAATPFFWQTVGLSLVRVFAGTFLGVLAGTALALLTFRFSLCHRLLAPAIGVIRATPVASFLLLLLLWTQRGVVPAIIAGLMTLPVLWQNVSQGLARADGQLLELAHCYRFPRWKTLYLVYLPAVTPHFRSGLLTGIGLAWKSGVAAEVLCLPRPGMGTEIYNAKLYLEIPQLFAWTVTVVALSLFMERLLGMLLGRKERL